MWFHWKKGKIKRGIAWVLVFAMLIQAGPTNVKANQETADIKTESGKEVLSESQTDVKQTDNAEQSREEKESKESEQSAEDSQTNEDSGSVFAEGKIKIYSLTQLKAIGTGQVVTTADDKEEAFGTGEEILANGEAVTYALDADYMLMNEIPLSSEEIWTLPEGFSGSFAGTPTEDAKLYDSQNDTIYVYNNYQLLTIAAEEGAKEPVMSDDMIPEKFGIGQMIYPDGEADGNAENISQDAENYLTYSQEHTYVLSPDFTEQMPELVSEKVAKGQVWLTGEEASGRSYPGQLYEEIDGEKYILIGNESQLRAIGSDKHVTPRLYICNKPGVIGGIFKNPTYVPYYPGDADLGLKAVAEKGGTQHDTGIFGGKENDKVTSNVYSYYYKEEDVEKPEAAQYQLADVNLSDDNILDALLGILGGILGGLLGGNAEFCGVDENGLPNYDKASLSKLRSVYGGLKYSSDANYIIFRNIDLTAGGENSNKQDDNWEPIHFSGKMEGRLDMQEGNEPTIKNIKVEQSGLLNMKTINGIGFFGTISNNLNESTLASAGTVVVKNIHLEQVDVTNYSTEVENNVDSLIEGVLGLLGGLLEGILGSLGDLFPIIGDLKLGKVIRDLLTLKMKSPDLFATGSFAGRIVGDVRVENCTVDQASVTSRKGISGGFVGFTEGVEEYDGLSDILGGVVKVLSTLLNILPGVGLGDLITVLLENDVSLGQLIPVGYYNPSITECSVTLASGSIGNAEQDYNGGFVGIQTGTKMSNCSVQGLTDVQAKTGAGGFAGVEKDAQIQGLLNDLGVDLVEFDIKSRQTNCSVSGTEISITAKEEYAGGMNGLMANSISTAGQISNLQEVTAKKYVGGFAGRATIGYGVAVGNDKEQNGTLLKAVSGLLVDLVAPGNSGKLTTLLSLVGAQPSEIYGSTVSGTDWTVTATGDYAGGLIGQGDGTKIDANEETGNSIQGLSSVKAENYAGGIAGSIVTANPIGVLNSTIGVGSYLPFTVSDVTLNGNDLKIEAAKKYAAGGMGLMLGGTVEQVQVTGVDSVTAGNYAGGLGGRAGSGSLVREEGLDLLGLGLIKVDNLLSLMDGVEVKITDTNVAGTDTGMVIHSTGNAEITDGESILAGGLISEAEGIQVKNSEVSNLKQVSVDKQDEKDTYAGGFIGRSHTGGLAGLAVEKEGGGLNLPGIVDVNGLLNLVPYLVPKYTNCKVTFVSNEDNPQVQAACAGGFFGAMQSGVVDNSNLEEWYAVYGLEAVEGESYAGGFAGKADAGATAASDGLKLLGGILNLKVNELLNVLNVYVPEIHSAGVQSAQDGFTVVATAKDSAAGGYIGYGSGVQIEKSDVTSLKHTNVTPPENGLESADADSYFDETQSNYAVKGGKYAGGYIGCVDIDSAAAAGGGLGLLGDAIQISDLLSVLDAVPSIIKDSNVSGCVGGFSVLADGKNNKDEIIGKAGGFAGEMSGAQIRRSHVENFAYIIGREMAGGYVGLMEPGDVASILDDATILNKVVGIQNSLANLVNAFIPIIEDSQTSSVPCGGAVRAEGFTDTMTTRGIAGGYAGYNHGGRIDGTNTECAVNRIRSVYGGEYAGGFTGLMENADLAGTGKLSLLFGLVELGNVLSLLGAVYPTETNTAVYGPLRNMNVDTWNAWAEAVGSNGVYGYQFPTETVETQEELDKLIQQYAYGYNVKAGRTSVGGKLKQAGSAGGYVGTMLGGVVTEAHAWDAKNVTAYQSAGGFAGEMLTVGAAQVGDVSIIGLPITRAISAVQSFVPVIRNSDITGFQSGLQVKATGLPESDTSLKIEKVGYAGGFVGHMIGGQIWGNWNQTKTQEDGISGFSQTDAKPDPDNDRCFVANLRKVEGTNAVGGFAGQIDPGSAAALDTAGSSGLLGGLLQKLINTPGDLLSLLNSTLSTVRAADVKAWDDWGIVINGIYTDTTNGNKNTKYAKSAGGFAGEMNGAVIGEADKPESGVQVSNLRSVTGGEYAGGFFGLADVSAVAEITGEGNTSILAGLLGLGSVDVLDAFRTYIYYSDVAGTEKAGLEVQARDQEKLEYENEPFYTGNAGGFGGALLNGSVKNSNVTNLREVEGQSYTGGFIGHLGKSGVVDLDKLDILGNVIGLGAGVLDIFGSHVDNSGVTGMEGGFTVKSDSTVIDEEKSEIAGGFTGYADLAKLDGNTVTNLKQVASGEMAGGFAGRTSFNYLVDVKADSPLVNVLLEYLNEILKKLWVADLENSNVVHIDLGIISVDALYEGDLFHINLLGLDIKIALAKEQQLATVSIGDSKIQLNCTEDGITDNEKLKNEIAVSLIKANRTKIENSIITGIAEGYDVYGGGAGNDSNGSGEYGFAGGFVGLNDEGLLKNNQMYLADVIRGTTKKTGAFTGASSLESAWNFNTVKGIEGTGNYYRIYRKPDAAYDKILGNDQTELQNTFEATENWNIYEIWHIDKVRKFTDLENAVMSNGTEEKDLLAYMEDGAMAVLMNNTPTTPTEPDDTDPPEDVQDPCTDTVELNIQKVWKHDNEADRPEAIRLIVTRYYMMGNEKVVDEEFWDEIILTKEDYSTKNIWEKVVSGSKYTAYHVGDNDEKYYYIYEVTEDKLDGYTTTITYKGDNHYNIKITNEKSWFDSLLPDTGGAGRLIFYTVGILLLAALGMTEMKRRKRRKAELL